VARGPTRLLPLRGAGPRSRREKAPTKKKREKTRKKKEKNKKLQREEPNFFLFDADHVKGKAPLIEFANGRLEGGKPGIKGSLLREGRGKEDDGASRENLTVMLEGLPYP